MAYKITDDCICCGVCIFECKNNAVSEGETTCVIDANKCTECVGYYNSPKCAEVCPVGAPQPDPDQVETKEQLLQKWYILHPNAVPASH